jgi:predicted transcriptional regulator
MTKLHEEQRRTTVMSKKESVNNLDAVAHDAPDTASGGGDGVVMPPPPNAPTTPAVRALWPILTAQPGATTAELADAAKVSRSATAKALAALEGAGQVNRIAGGRKGARLFPDRWEPRAQAEQARSESDGDGEAATTAGTDGRTEEVVGSDGGDEPEEAPAAETASDGVETGELEPVEAQPRPSGESARLRSGALREMVVDHLREHPGEDLSPTALGKALARSSGAIANACEKLAADGVVTKTSQKPRRYRFGPDGS